MAKENLEIIDEVKGEADELVKGINFSTGEEVEYSKFGKSLTWNFTKELVNRKDKNGAYRVKATLILESKEHNGVKHQIKLQTQFTDEEIDLVNFYGNEFFNKLNTRVVTQQKLLTRFIYGKQEETGDYYLMALISICDNNVNKRVKFSYSFNKMFNDAYKNGYPFKICADERTYEFEQEDDLSTAL